MAEMIAYIGRPPIEVRFGENTEAALQAAALAQAVLTNPGFVLVATDLGLGGASKIGIVSTNMAAVTSVAGNAANINTAAGLAGPLATVSGIAAAITITAANNSNITLIGTDLALGGSSLLGQGPAVIAAISAALAIVPSYVNTAGTGARTSLITVISSAGLITGGTGANLVNGSTSGSNYTASAGFAAVALPGVHYLGFDFGIGAAKVITEAKWYQSGANSHGVWQWKGTNDLLAATAPLSATWTSIGATFTLGGSTTQTQATLSANTAAYRFYFLFPVSGTASGGPYLHEIEFKIGGNQVDGMITVPVGGVFKSRLRKKSGATGDLEWAHPLFDNELPVANLLRAWDMRDGVDGAILKDLSGNGHDINLAAPANQNYRKTNQGILLLGGLIDSATVINGRVEEVIVYRMKPGDTGGIYTGTGTTFGTGVFGGSMSVTDLAYRVGFGTVREVAVTTGGTAHYALTAGGWICLFISRTAGAVNGRHGIGGHFGQTTSRCAHLEVACHLMYSAANSDATRTQIFEALCKNLASRGIRMRNEECSRKVNGVFGIGQSNMEGKARIAGTGGSHTGISATNAAKQTFCSFGLFAREATQQIRPRRIVYGQSHALDNMATFYGPALAASWAYEGLIDTVNRDLYMCMAGKGSTWLHKSTVNPTGSGGIAGISSPGMTWNPTEIVSSGLLYVSLRAAYRLEQWCYNNDIGIDWRAVWYMQGEQDGVDQVASATFEANITALIAAVRKYLKPAIKFVIGRVVNTDPVADPVAIAQVRTAQNNVATTSGQPGALPGVVTFNTDDITTEADLVHYEGKDTGMPVLGARFVSNTDWLTEAVG